MVRVLHAPRDAPEEISHWTNFSPVQPRTSRTGRVIEQPYQERLAKAWSAATCRAIASRGFGHQTRHGPRRCAGRARRSRTALYTSRRSAFQRLNELLESGGVAKMPRLLDITGETCQ